MPRHAAVQDTIFTIMSSSGQSVQREVALPSAQDAHLRPADLLLFNWHGGKPTALDVTVAHGWPRTGTSTTSAVSRDNWRPFLRRKELEKHAKYDGPCEAEGWHFAAAAFGTWGGVGPEGAKVLSRILKRAACGEEGREVGLVQRQATEALGLALFRQVLAMLEAKNFIS